MAVVSFAQSANVRRLGGQNEVEMLLPVIAEVFGTIGITKDDVGFICSGSTDYLVGGPFSFVGALDAVGVWPPRSESHVEMDGAWALYEAWVRLQEGDIDAALVYGFGKSSSGDLRKILALQLDPYVMAPLWPDPVALAALQAQALIDAGQVTEADLAAVAARSRRSALDNPKAQVAYDRRPKTSSPRTTSSAPCAATPCPPSPTGRRPSCWRPATEPRGGSTGRPGSPASTTGSRPTPSVPGTSPLRLRRPWPSERAGVSDEAVDVAELHAPFAHQELIVAQALGLGSDVTINPSGGALAANPLMSAGLVRIGEAASRVMDGTATRAVAHATSGPCLQQNLVCRRWRRTDG